MAFRRGKRVICMDGLDLYDTLDREIPLDHVLERKVRRAAETGAPFVEVRELSRNSSSLLSVSNVERALHIPQ